MLLNGIYAHLKNETHKILRNLEIQTDPPIPARRHDLEIIYKKKKKIIPAEEWTLRLGEPEIENQRKKKRETWTLTEN